MASYSSSSSWPSFFFVLVSSLCMFGMNISTTSAQLSFDFYATSCPNLLPTIQAAVVNAVSNEARMGASLLRLHFHDCFGCDASILLDDTSSFTGEKTAGPNANPVRGFDIIDPIKTQVEALCPKTVSCADILAVSAGDSVAALGGRSWVVQLGIRDAKTASMSDANSNLPAATLGLSSLITSFSNKGFTTMEIVILSCKKDFFIHTKNSSTCSTDAQVTTYNNDNLTFLTDFVVAMVKMGNLFTDFAVAMVKKGNLSPVTGTKGEVRTNCRELS
ncbi:hypothetical protein MKX01_012482 [Papaver californicum]|nr:hypothetical protein MKX01_012482 [Papaver californicum]